MPSLVATPDPQEVRRDVVRALSALPLALAFQALLFGAVWLTSSRHPPKSARAASQIVSLRPISSSRWASNRGPSSATPLERAAPLHPKGQVVDVAPGNEQIPQASDYLAETNNRVQQQTHAREQTQVWSRATARNQPHPTALPSAKGRIAPQVEKATAPNFLTSALGRRQWSLFGERTIAGVADAPNTETTAPVGTEAGTQPIGSDTSEGGGAPNDDLGKVAPGDTTSLNTREWKYAAFFNRVKQAVAGKWDPNGRLKGRERSLGLRDRQTTLHVALRPDGSLADVYVARGSGIDELDQEAVHAFEQAQPFSNPPAALVEQGFVRFTFAFSLTNGELAGGIPRFAQPYAR